MTTLIRRLAGVLTVAESTWLLYSFFYGPTVMISCPANGCPGPQPIPIYSAIALPLAVILLILGILGIWGASAAYVGGAVLSGVFLVANGYFVAAAAGYAYLSAISNEALIAVALGAIALAVNVAGMRSRTILSEQANPMNLPVFG